MNSDPLHPTFTRAIVRSPASNFSSGQTTQNYGAPDYALALEQHAAYCQALRKCGLDLIELEADHAYPDSTFVEDTAVLTAEFGLLTNPGHSSRRGEIDSIRETLIRQFSRLYSIQPPGTLDGGDICEAGSHFFIGISERTNVAGGVQLSEILGREGYTTDLVDIRAVPGILHLKSGLTYLGGNQLVVIEALAGLPVFRDYERIIPPQDEEYAANCVRVNDYVLTADGFPKFREMLETANYRLLLLNMSEFRKMDGGLSCLSLRF